MIVAAAASMIAIAAQAETNLEAATWIGGASGLWNDASNWSGISTPAFYKVQWLAKVNRYGAYPGASNSSS